MAFQLQKENIYWTSPWQTGEAKKNLSFGILFANCECLLFSSLYNIHQGLLESDKLHCCL